MRRLIITTVVLLAVLWPIYRFFWLPYRCNIQIGKATLLTEQVWSRSGQISAAILARSLVKQMEDCLRSCPNVAAYMLGAANFRILGRHHEALALYREALKIDRRPEVYLGR